MKKILVVGSLNMDHITKVVATPQIGETVMGEGLDLIPGGKGANQAVALGKLGAPVEMIGVVGSDNNGKVLIDNLMDMNVETSKILVDEDYPTGIAFIMINASADNSIVVIPSANSRLLPAHVKESWFDNIDILVCQLETPIETVNKVLAFARMRGIQTVLNPAPARKLPKTCLLNTDLLVPNETEFEILTGISIRTKQDFKNGFKLLNNQGIREMIVTLGERGAWYFNGKDFIDVKSHKVTPVDTTAAGDSFIGGLVFKLSKGADMKEAMEFGTRVAAITITRYGAQSSLPYLDEVVQKRGESNDQG